MSNFFRLNVDKLLTKLPRPVTFNESQQAMIQGLNENRFFVHIAARRTGKSYAAAILAFAKLLEPGQQVMVVAPNFSLSSIICILRQDHQSLQRIFLLQTHLNVCSRLRLHKFETQ